MLKSMTGYGRVLLEEDNRTISIEIRSLNNKFLDINMRMPQEFRSKELQIRKMVGERLTRGKVDVTIGLDQAEIEQRHQINNEAIDFYLQGLRETSERHQIELPNLMEVVMRLPNATVPELPPDPESEWPKIEEAIRDCCEQLMAFRAQEGSNLEEDVVHRVGLLRQLREQVAEMEPARTDRLRGKLHRQFEEMQSIKVDENRFEQEMIYYLEKIDITEELVRLKSHLDYFETTLNTEGLEKGKKMGFVCQEIGREINTIGSKANDAGIQQVVIKMKDELEKIKEQSLNVL